MSLIRLPCSLDCRIGMYANLGALLAEIHVFGVPTQIDHRPRLSQWVFLRHSGLVIAIGIVAGLPFSFMAASMAGSMLWGVKAEQMSIYAGLRQSLLIVGMVSPYLPARRAAKIEPAPQLRTEGISIFRRHEVRRDYPGKQ